MCTLSMSNGVYTHLLRFVTSLLMCWPLLYLCKKALFTGNLAIWYYSHHFSPSDFIARIATKPCFFGETKGFTFLILDPLRNAAMLN